MSKSVLGEMPEGVESAMFLRDGWPHAVVCKIVKGGCVGIGIYRPTPGRRPVNPEFADQAAMVDALANLADEPPDYTEIQEHLARMAQAAAQARGPYPGEGVTPAEVDDDLQASLGQKAHG